MQYGLGLFATTCGTSSIFLMIAHLVYISYICTAHMSCENTFAPQLVHVSSKPTHSVCHVRALNFCFLGLKSQGQENGTAFLDEYRVEEN